MKKRVFFDATPLALWEQEAIHRTGIGRMATRALRALLRREDVQLTLFCPRGLEERLGRFMAEGDWARAAEVLPLPGRPGAARARRARDFLKRIVRRLLLPWPSPIQALARRLSGLNPFSGYDRPDEELRRAVAARLGAGPAAWFSCYQPIPAGLGGLAGLQKHVVLHDIIPLRLPDKHPSSFAFRGLMRRHLERADRIWANSEFTRRDFLDYFPDAPKEKVRTAPHGGGEHFAPAGAGELSAARAFCGLPAGAPYFASLATLEPRKGFLAVIRAFNILERKDAYLVLAGHKGWSYAPILREISRNERIITPGFVPDAVIPGLLGGSQGFVYMSEYEGFGLPVVEAMSLGAPVIAARATSLIEVAGEAAILVPPGDIPALAGAMARLMDEPALAEDLRRRGRERARNFSWDVFADIVVGAIGADDFQNSPGGPGA